MNVMEQLIPKLFAICWVYALSKFKNDKRPF